MAGRLGYALLRVIDFTCKDKEFLGPSVRARVWFSFERIILDGFYKMRWRNDLTRGVWSCGALCRCLAMYSEHEANLLEMRGAAGDEVWVVAVGVWYLGANDQQCIKGN